MRRVTLAIILSLSTAALAVGPATASQSALKPGKPAGIKQAQEQDSMLPLAVFGAAAVDGIALAVSDNDTATPGTPPPTTTTTTGTAP